jgi:hypothetical protein
LERSNLFLPLVFHVELNETFHCLHVNCGISDTDESVPEHKDTQPKSADEDTAGAFGLVAGNAIDSDSCWVLDSGASESSYAGSTTFV